MYSAWIPGWILHFSHPYFIAQPLPALQSTEMQMISCWDFVFVYAWIESEIFALATTAAVKPVNRRDECSFFPRPSVDRSVEERCKTRCPERHAVSSRWPVERAGKGWKVFVFISEGNPSSAAGDLRWLLAFGCWYLQYTRRSVNGKWLNCSIFVRSMAGKCSAQL